MAEFLSKNTSKSFLKLGYFFAIRLASLAKSSVTKTIAIGVKFLFSSFRKGVANDIFYEIEL